MKKSGVYPESAQIYIALLEKQLADKDLTIKNLKDENNYLQEKLKVQLYRRFCKSSEKDRGQLLLFNTENRSDDPEETQEKEAVLTVKTYTRRAAKGRKRLNEAIPRVEKIIDISAEEKKCACGAELVRIGEERSERLVVIPEKVYVEVTVRPRYACHACEGSGDEGHKAVRTAPVPPVLIPGSITTPELLAFIFTNKFALHLPYYRQSVHFEEIGAAVSRQDMSGWQEKAGRAVKPLLEKLKEELKKGSAIHMDETPVQVLHESSKADNGSCRGYMWAAAGGRKGSPVVLYRYHPGRQAVYVKEYLDGYKGFLQTDGYAGYTNVERDYPGVIHAGCFAHARRRFVEALKVNPQNVFAKEALGYIAGLYDTETKLRKQNLEPAVFQSLRNKKCTEILARFRDRLEIAVQPGNTLSPLTEKAAAYTLNQWDILVKYLACPDLTPDNNVCENAVRPFVVGRKNWLFSGSTEGAESSCALFSLIETAKKNGVKPYTYLRYIFSRIPLIQSDAQWDALLPWNLAPE